MEFVIRIPNAEEQSDAKVSLEQLLKALENFYFAQVNVEYVYLVHCDNPELFPIFKALAGPLTVPPAAPVAANNGKAKGKRGPYKRRGELKVETAPAGDAPVPDVSDPNPIHIVTTDLDGAGVLRTIKAHGAIKGRRL